MFVMTLDTCHASVQRDVASAKSKFEDLKLKEFPPENVMDLAAEAKRLINVVKGSCALPIVT